MHLEYIRLMRMPTTTELKTAVDTVNAQVVALEKQLVEATDQEAREVKVGS